MEKLKHNQKKVSNIKLFITKCNRKGINYPSKTNDWKTFVKNNLAIALNITYYRKRNIFSLYFKSQFELWKTNNSLNGPERSKKKHYLVVKKLSALLKRIISKHVGDFCCMHCFHSLRKGNKLKSREKVFKNKDFCGTVMQWKNDNISHLSIYEVG